ncbi:phosphonoacetaldehyde reductase [Candidatus Woesearchaeota archaeon]|nr:phosphonoacetaldehyde reductase [Candidatus Woesearchaeota archaeon]
MTQNIYSGYGSYRNLEQTLKELSPKKIFLVTGKASYLSCGARQLLDPILKKYSYVHFHDFEINPKIEDIKKGISLMNKEECDLVVAVGGGSVIDVSKAVNILSAQEGDVEQYVTGNDKIKQEGLPLVAIPTTAGTGSESTHFSVVYKGKVKYSLAHEFMLPDYVILDPIFTEQLPPHITACTGMDALCQAIESLWSVNSTEESRECSRQAIDMIRNNIFKAVNMPDRISREAMLKGANLAGKAINISKTTAAHAVSYPITSYFGVSHGHAVALTLPYFIVFNGQVDDTNLNDMRGPDFVRKIMDDLYNLLGVKVSYEARDMFITLMNNIGLETRLSKLGVDRKGIEIIIKNGFNPQRVKNNPRTLTEETLRIILEGIL